MDTALETWKSTGHLMSGTTVAFRKASVIVASNVQQFAFDREISRRLDRQAAVLSLGSKERSAVPPQSQPSSLLPNSLLSIGGKLGFASSAAHQDAANTVPVGSRVH